MPLRLHFLSIALALLSLPAAAQTEPTRSDSIAAIGERYAVRLDSIAACRLHAAGNYTAAPDGRRDEASGMQGLSNPYFFPLFAGTTLLHLPLQYTLGTIAPPNYGGVFAPPCLSPMVACLADSYTRQPWLVRYDLTPAVSAATLVQRPAGAPDDTTDHAAPGLPSSAGSEEGAAGVSDHASHVANDRAEVDKPDVDDGQRPDVLDLSDFHIHVRRPNFWRLKGSFSTQFMQYYVSDNWYKGGDNHVSMLGQLTFEANYDNKQKFTFSNKLEAKLGFQTSPSDEYHTFKTNADLLRLTNKLGLQAHKHWYYSAMLQSWTQFYRAYKSNSPDVSSNFLSPFESVLSVGMDYKLDKRRVNLNVNIAPAALDYKFCRSRDLIGAHIKDGEHPERHYKVSLGSTLTANMTLKLCKQVSWQSRFYCFYNYKSDTAGRRDQVKCEWENTINLKVNKYLSSKIFLYPRYEGGLKKNIVDPETGDVIIGTRSKLQFNEYLSVGFDINF